MTPLVKTMVLCSLAAVCAIGLTSGRRGSAGERDLSERAVYAAILSKLHALEDNAPAPRPSQIAGEVQQTIARSGASHNAPAAASARLERVEFGATHLSEREADVQVVLFGANFVRPLRVKLRRSAGEWKIERVSAESAVEHARPAAGIRL